MRSWRCRLCGGPVEMHFDHVGNCGAATVADCPGTFAHPRAGSCARRGADLSHDEVRISSAAVGAQELP